RLDVRQGAVDLVDLRRHLARDHVDRGLAAALVVDQRVLGAAGRAQQYLDNVVGRADARIGYRQRVRLVDADLDELGEAFDRRGRVDEDHARHRLDVADRLEG